MNKRLKRCPVCNIDLMVTEYYCGECEITIKGKFNQGELGSLSLVQQEFVKVFLMSQGSIKEVERRLGISYPTVKNRLLEINRALNPTYQEESSVTDVLDSISKGDLTVDDAIKFLVSKQGEKDGE